MGFKAQHFVLSQDTKWMDGNYELDPKLEAVANSPFTMNPILADKMYPASKFIYTTREKATWLKSLKRWLERSKIDPEGRVLNFAEKMARLYYLGSVNFNEMVASSLYETHAILVRTYFAYRFGIRKDVLAIPMEMEDEKKWRLLCTFLEKPLVQGRPFPKANSYEQFLQTGVES